MAWVASLEFFVLPSARMSAMHGSWLALVFAMMVTQPSLTETASISMRNHGDLGPYMLCDILITVHSCKPGGGDKDLTCARQVVSGVNP